MGIVAVSIEWVSNHHCLCIWRKLPHAIIHLSAPVRHVLHLPRRFTIKQTMDCFASMHRLHVRITVWRGFPAPALHWHITIYRYGSGQPCFTDTRSELLWFASTKPSCLVTCGQDICMHIHDLAQLFPFHVCIARIRHRQPHRPTLAPHNHDNHHHDNTIASQSQSQQPPRRYGKPANPAPAARGNPRSCPRRPLSAPQPCPTTLTNPPPPTLRTPEWRLTADRRKSRTAPPREPKIGPEAGRGRTAAVALGRDGEPARDRGAAARARAAALRPGRARRQRLDAAHDGCVAARRRGAGWPAACLWRHCRCQKSPFPSPNALRDGMGWLWLTRGA